MHSNVHIAREKMKKRKNIKGIDKITRKRGCILLDQKTQKYSLFVISQNIFSSQNHVRRQIIPALKCIKCTFNSCFRQTANRKLLECISK